VSLGEFVSDGGFCGGIGVQARGFVFCDQGLHLISLLFLAVGDAWTHFPELYSMSSYTHHYYLADFTLMSL
jgi:hypothetical protein